MHCFFSHLCFMEQWRVKLEIYVQFYKRFVARMSQRGNELFTSIILDLAQKLFSPGSTVSRAREVMELSHSLGLPVHSHFTHERVIFIAAQAIINLLDEVVSEDELREELKNQAKQMKDRYITRVDEGEDVPMQGFSTTNNRLYCLLGNLNIAVNVFCMFSVGEYHFWDIIQTFAGYRRAIKEKQYILESISLRNRIINVQKLEESPYDKKTNKCYCMFSRKPRINSRTITCPQCQDPFHPDCQATPLFCNSCFLRYCIVDHNEGQWDPLSVYKSIQEFFFGYLTTNLQFHRSMMVNEHIYFQIVRFDLPEFTKQTDSMRRTYFLKLSLADSLYPTEQQLPIGNLTGLKTRQVPYMWKIGDDECHFYLNHSKISYTCKISKSCIIFKLQSRLLQRNSNIIVLKCIRRDPKPGSMPLESPIMVGVYANVNPLRKKNANTSSFSTLKHMPIEQSKLFVSYVLGKVNGGISYQIVSLLDPATRAKIKTPIRSYGCDHLQCFDLDAFQTIVKERKQPKLKLLKDSKNTAQTIELDVEGNNEPIDLDSSESVKIMPAVIPVPKFKQIRKKSHQRRAQEKQEKKGWDCPICGRNMLVLYEDPFFKNILKLSGAALKVRIFAEGNYNFDVYAQ